nr:uncharacterized protein LOC100181043 [Ciona intestinalis]|eukprot:XP_002123054.1 uncharacterized protein LOC100181043 [Ciona intestinalis]
MADDPTMGEECTVETNVDTLKNTEDVFSIPVSSLTCENVESMAMSVWKDLEVLQPSVEGTLQGMASKLVKMFEILDSLVKNQQSSTSNTTFQNPSVKKLQLEMKLSEEKHEEELDAIKAAWKEDINDWKESLELVQEDNQRLALMLSEKLEVCIDTSSPHRDNETDDLVQPTTERNELNEFPVPFQPTMFDQNFQATETEDEKSSNLSPLHSMEDTSEFNGLDPFLYYPDNGYTFEEYFAEPTFNKKERKMERVNHKLKFVAVPGKTIYHKEKLHDNQGYSYKVKKVSAKGTVKWKCTSKVTKCKASVKEKRGMYKLGHCEHNHKAVPKNKQAVIAQIKENQVKKAKRRKRIRKLEKMQKTLDPEVFSHLGLSEPEVSDYTLEPVDLKPIKHKLLKQRRNRRIDTTVTRISMPHSYPLQTSKMENENAINSLNSAQVRGAKSVRLTPEEFLKSRREYWSQHGTDLPEESEVDEIQYTVIEGGSSRGSDKLFDSLGHSYNGGAIYSTRGSATRHWRCSVRNKKTYCHASVTERSGVFMRGNRPHNHKPRPGHDILSVIMFTSKQAGCEHLNIPASSIARDIVGTYLPEDHGFQVKMERIERRINKYRQNLRRPTKSKVKTEMKMEPEMTFETLINNNRGITVETIIHNDSELCADDVLTEPGINIEIH